MLLISFLLCFFSKYVFMSVLSLYLFWGPCVASVVFIFVIITPFACFKSLFCPFFAFQLYWYENEKSKITGDNENREQDSWQEWYVRLWVNKYSLQKQMLKNSKK